MILAPELVRILLGKSWSDAVLPFQILAVSMVPRTTFKLGVTVARAAGDVFPVAFANIFYAVSVIGGALYAVRWGIPGVAVSTAICVFVNFFILSHLGLRRTTLRWSGFLGAHVEPIIAGVLVTLAAWPTATLMRQMTSSAWLIVAVVSIVGLIAGTAALALGVLRRSDDWLWFYRGLSGRLKFLPPARVPLAEK
jgi:PST family polysaccharide transporter